MSSYYPAGPVSVPGDLTRPTLQYRLQVMLVLVSLLISIVLYFVLLVGSAWLSWWSVTASWPARADRGYAFFRLIAIAFAGLLFLYLFKGLFKHTFPDRSLLVEITPEEQPELFDFLRRLCAETGAPLPHQVFVSPEVNAAVFYNSTFLSLFLPAPKNLLIGLGLVNMLSLSEFKAVLAHEFGHFSQGSMRVGSYVYVANRVLADVIYGRDFLDNFLRRAKSWDLRIAVILWVFLGVLWVLRKVLTGIFKVINLANLSLSRQMEFNADRVAISVAGSDAMVHALLRSSFADQAFRQLANDLWAAADHHLYSRDIFAHQQGAGLRVRRLTKKPRLGEPPAERGPGVRVFSPHEDVIGVPPMWATHPANQDREENAKAVYLGVDLDERPAWLLFRDQEQLRFEVSSLYYQVMHKLEAPPEFAEPERVQQFLDEEYAETTYADRYAGFYDNRYLEIADFPALLQKAAGAPWAEDVACREIELLYGPALSTWVEGHEKRLAELDLLTGLRSGQLSLKGKTIAVRDQAHAPGEVDRLLFRVKAELKEDQAYKVERDERVFLAHYQLAQHLGEGPCRDLTDRYGFHLRLQGLHQQIMQGFSETQEALRYAGSRSELNQEEFATVRGLLNQAAGRLHYVLVESSKMFLPPLKNMPAGLTLRVFLLQKPLIAMLASTDANIGPEWVQQLMNQLHEVLDKLKRLLFKSLGGVLAVQEQIVQEWLERCQAETGRWS